MTRSHHFGFDSATAHVWGREGASGGGMTPPYHFKDFDLLRSNVIAITPNDKFYTIQTNQHEMFITSFFYQTNAKDM